MSKEIKEIYLKGDYDFESWDEGGFLGMNMDEIYKFAQDVADHQTTHLTDQIKSMENYISDVDGQVKEYPVNKPCR